jgi:IstB-like ATP binding protein
LALSEPEVAQREQHRQAQLIRAARFPVLKDLAAFDFSSLSTIHNPPVLDLARGDALRNAELLLMLGNPDRGHPPLATGLALAACRQGYHVRFYNAASLVNELIQVQDDLRRGIRGFSPVFPRAGDPCFQLATDLEQVRGDVNDDILLPPSISCEVFIDGGAVPDLFPFRTQSLTGGLP